MSEPGAMRVRQMIIHAVLALLALSVFVYLVWALRALIVPLVVGALLAYAVRPLVELVKRWGLAHGVAVSVIFLAFAAGLVLLVSQIQAVWPDHQMRLEFRVLALYKLNQKYRAVLGLDESQTKGNVIYDRFGDELDRFMWRIRDDLWLTAREQDAFLAARAGQEGRPVSDKIYKYYVADIGSQEKAAKRMQQIAGPGSASAISQSTSVLGAYLSRLAELLSYWVVMPITFLFFLVDEGEIRRGFIEMIPNRYFEPTLNVLADLDKTVGSYLRSVILECSLVGITYMGLLWVVGLPGKWAVVIGVLAGIVNVIPYGGSVIGLSLGLVYALLADEVHSLLPIVNAGNLWLWVVAVALVTRVLDDAVFQPMVFGGALELHPLVVALGIVGASLLFGLAGAIFAVPAIALAGVFFKSTMKELRAYSII